MLAKIDTWMPKARGQSEEDRQIARILFVIIFAALILFSFVILIAQYWRQWDILGVSRGYFNPL